MQGQQTPTPPSQTGADGSQSQLPQLPSAGDNALQLPGIGDGQLQPPAANPAANNEEKKPPIDPRSGLPLTPAEQREREIDLLDPLKRASDPTAPEAIPLTDRQTPADAVNPNSTSEPPAESAPTPDQGPVTSSRSAGQGSNSSTGGFLTDNPDNGTDYTGPAVLTRSYTLARPLSSAQIKWKYSLGLSYAVDLGQIPGTTATGSGTTTTTTPTTTTTTTQSRSATWSLNGRHAWKHDQLGVSYNGNYSQYGSSNLSGLNNGLNLDYYHGFSRRLSFQLVESLQDLSQNYYLENPALQSGSSVANINLATSPNLQLLENTVRQSSSSASVTYRPRSRLSMNLSASYFAIGRTGVGVVGMTGEQASADLNYRWTRKATVGVFYSYTNYQYSHNVLQSDASSFGVVYSYALNSRVQLRTRFGISRIESLGYATVALPPELAFILGEDATIVNAYTRNSTSDISVDLVREFRRSRTATLAYARGESPGNGVLLTSIQQTVTAGFATSFLRRRLPVSTGVVYSALSATTQGNLGFYKSETVYFSTSRPLRRGVSATLRVDYRRYDISGSPLLQHDLRFSVSFAWSPPDNRARF